MEDIRLLSLFSGIGAPEKALSALGVPFTLTAFSEIDPYAAKAYCRIHGVSPDKNLGDITKIDIAKLEPFDMVTYGFPCQDISTMGNMEGLEEGTRSSLLWNALEIIKAHRPAIALAENVKNLVSKRFMPDFQRMLMALEELGYTNYWQVLNATDFDVPQNRERVFVVSIRKDQDTGFVFPQPVPTRRRLIDMLVPAGQVDEKYYYPKEKVEPLIKKFLDEGRTGVFGVLLDRGKLRISDVRSSCIDANYWKGVDNHAQRTQIVTIGMHDFYKGFKRERTVYSVLGASPTLLSVNDGGHHPTNIQLYASIRKLTPQECWRLMGFSDVDFIKASSDISNTQLYKMAGNSIVVDVLVALFKSLLKVGTNENILTQPFLHKRIDMAGTD